MKLLIVTFYFPPSGGGGVQRMLKFATHLSADGIDVHVLTPHDPNWIHRDEDLAIPAGITVHRSLYLGPKGRRPAEELHGLRSAPRLMRRLSLLPRRFHIPDENAAWTLTAAPTALRLARRERFDAVLTTSPPSSVNLIGSVLTRRLKIPWIADLRDSVTAKEDRRQDQILVRMKEHTQRYVAKLIARDAAAVVGVTPSICAEIGRLQLRGRVATIANGCDFDDFDDLAYTESSRFRITHTGSFFGQRSPRPFLTALADSKLDAVARFVGDFRAADREWAETLDLGDRLEIHPFLPHHAALQFQRDSEALLLLLPEIGARGKDIPSGKLYEYIAARRPIIAAVPPDGTAAKLIRDANLGVVVAPDDVAGMRQALETLATRWKRGELHDTTLKDDLRTNLSRQTRARELAHLLQEVVGSS